MIFPSWANTFGTLKKSSNMIFIGGTHWQTLRLKQYEIKRNEEISENFLKIWVWSNTLVLDWNFKMCNIQRIFIVVPHRDLRNKSIISRHRQKSSIIFAEYKIGQTCQKLSDVCQEKRLQGHEMETEYLNIMWRNT